MRYCIYKNDEIVNIIEASEAFCAAYCEENGFTYKADPQPEPEPVEPEPTEEDDTAAMLVDHEYRLTMLELGLFE